jgi:hypothetical protein
MNTYKFSESVCEALGLQFDKNSALSDNDLVVPHRFDPSISREEALTRNSEIVVCDKCGVSGNRPNMMRWHFDNCKTVFRKCEQCHEIIPKQGIKDFQYNVKKYCNRKCYMEYKKGRAPIVMTKEIREKLSVAAKKRQSDIRSARMNCE